MLLQIEGLDKAQTQFRHLWGSYVIGFRPATHCRNTFERHDETQVKPGMADGVYELDDTYELFYLCGVGLPHLSQPESEAVAKTAFNTASIVGGEGYAEERRA
jgi:hypothetical protein